MKTRFFAILLSVALSAQVCAQPLGSVVRKHPQASEIGINLSGVVDWSGDMMFVDLMKHARSWGSPESPWDDKGPSVDAQGWPTGDCGTVFSTLEQTPVGTYKLSLTGQAEIVGIATNGKVEKQSYDAQTNRTTADYVHGGGQIILSFRNTKRKPGDTTATGFTDLRFLRPDMKEGDLFSRPLKEFVSRFKVVRMMDSLGVNGTNVNGDWTKRRLPTDARQVPIAWEHATRFCNETDSDFYVNLPWNADDAYIRNVALLLKNGSDGVNPYAKTVAKPKFPGLKANLKIYVEWSNELWNSFGEFPANANRDAAVREVKAGGSPLNYDGESGEWNWAWRRTAKRTVDVSNIFRGVFGDAQMMTRVRPVLMWQQANGQNTAGTMFDFLNGYYNNPKHVPTPRPVSYYIYGGGGSAYYNPSDFSSVDKVLETLATNDGYGRNMALDGTFCALNNIKHISYEGGPGLDKGEHDDIKAKTVLDPRLSERMVEAQRIFDRNGGDLLIYFVSSGDFQWGFTPVVTQETPKTRAIDAINDQPRAPLTLGHAAPGRVPAGKWAMQSGYGPRDGKSIWNNNGAQWFVYLVRAPKTGTFKLNASVGAQQSHKVGLQINGKAVGDLPVTDTGGIDKPGDSPAINVQLREGLNTVRLQTSPDGWWNLHALNFAE